MAKMKVPKGTKNVDCIKILPQAVHKEYIEMYGRKNKGDPDVQSWAEREKFDYEQWKYRLDLHIAATARMDQAIHNHSTGVLQGVKSVLIPDRWEGNSFMSVEGRAAAVRGKLGSILADMMHEYRPRMLGFERDKKGMRNVIKEIFGEATDDQDASQYAQAWNTMSEYTRKRLVNAGASIARIGDDMGLGWGLPQYHNPGKVASMGKEAWMDLMDESLDWDRMVKETGLNRDELDDLLRWNVYDSIVTEGASKIDLGEISGKPKGKGLLTKLQQHRFLHFSDADAWMHYQDIAGHDDYMTAMMDFVNHQSMNISSMEVLGPNPEIGYQHLRNTLRLNGQDDQLFWLDTVYKNTVGAVGTSSQTAASVGSAVRSFNVFAHLGNATLSMITDPAFLTMTARINDVPVFKSLAKQLELSVKQGFGNTEGLKFAAQLGYVSEYASDRLIAASRFTDVAPHAVTARMSEMTVRASWMHAITVAGRGAFTLEYAAQLAREVDIPFEDLSRKRLAAFKRVGINKNDWNKIRSSPGMYNKGVKYIDVNSVGAGNGRETATKLGGLIQQEMNYAVPMPGAEQRAFQNFGQQRGTIPGEVSRFAMEFKSFPITILMLHGRRMLHQTAMNRAAYGGSLVTMLLGLGWAAVNAKDISRGRDPAPLLDEDGKPNLKQLGRIAAQSGAIGIYGDLIFQDHTRFGANPAETFLGPTFGGATPDAGKAIGLSLMATLESLGVVEDDDNYKKLKKHVGKIAQTYKPEIWQFRALEDRAINTAMDNWTDGDWNKSLRRAQKNRRKQLGQDNYWSEDSMVPERAPGGQ